MINKDTEKLLIVVDMVNGFIREGAMADSYIENIIGNIENLVRQNIDGTIFIKDCHEKDAIEFNSYPIHCLKGTSESELVEELKKYATNDNTYEKNSTSAMYAEAFLSDVDNMKNLKQVTIVGCCTDICVLNLAIPLNNYFNQKNRNIEIIVPKNAVETFNSETHKREEYNEMAFKLMAQAGVKVV